VQEWNDLFDQYEAALGSGSLSKMHLHFSGIAYGEKGEKKHSPVQEADLLWKDFLGVLKKREIGGILVSESPLMEDDALLLQTTLESL
jgi:deoxyribonuclease-4